MKFLLTIADTDEGYCNHFFNYITANEGKRIRASCITETRYAKTVIGEGNPTIDILLITQQMYRQIEDYTNVRTLIILSGGGAYEGIRERSVVNKYQAADILIEEVLHIYGEEHPQVYDTEKKNVKTKVIGVYSPVTRCGKTLVSVVLAKTLARSGKNVLYLNPEDFSVNEVYFDISEENQMADILYFAKKQRKDIVDKIIERACPIEGGRLFFVSSPISAEDILQTKPETWEFLINQIKESGKFDYVIADFQSKYDEMTLRLLELCSGVLFLVSKESEDNRRVEKFFGSVKNINSPVLQVPHIRILNQYAAGLPYEVPEGGKGIPFLADVVNKRVWPYEAEAESVMGRILQNAVNSFDMM